MKELPLHGKIINQNQCCISGGISEISANITELRDAGVGNPTSLFNSRFWSLQETDGILREMVHFCPLSQAKC